MKAIKTTGTVDAKGQLALDSPLAIDKQSRVEIIILIPEAIESTPEPPQEKILGDVWHEFNEEVTISVENRANEPVLDDALPEVERVPKMVNKETIVQIYDEPVLDDALPEVNQKEKIIGKATTIQMYDPWED